MSRIFSKLNEIQQKSPTASQAYSIPIDPEVPVTPKAQPKAKVEPKAKQFPIKTILGAAITVVVLIILGLLSINVEVVKNQKLDSLNAKIQQQQNQMVLINKNLAAVRSSVDERINKAQAAANDLNVGLENKFDALDNSVKSKLDQASTDANRMEAVLQANIDELNTKVNKLQKDQIKAVSSS